MWFRSRRNKLITVLAAVGILAVLIAVAVWLFAFEIPYNEAENTMDPNGTVVITEQADGTLLVQWPEGKNADAYVLEAVKSVDGEDVVIFSHEATDVRSCVLPQFPPDETVILRIRCSRTYSGGVREGTQALSVRLFPVAPAVTDPDWQVDVANGRLTLEFVTEPGDVCRLYTGRDGETPQYLQDVENGRVELNYGDGGIGIPDYGFQRHFYFEVCKHDDNLVFQGGIKPALSLGREDFLGTGLILECQEQRDNVYTLTWNETKGEYYEIQLSYDGVVWKTVGTVQGDAERKFVTDPLAPYCECKLRVLAVGGQTLPDSEYAAEPAEVSLSTKQRACYSTIWPIQDLDVYADEQKSVKLGKTLAGKALCVLGESNGLFKVRFENQEGYIDSNYCMIDLPEYIGSLCVYDITNSYRSIFLAHEFAIPGVSGAVLRGYEDVRLGAGHYVVPLLYPTAQKLITAAEDFLEQGYRICIYDTYRPNVSTGEIYSSAEKLLEKAVPKFTYNGKDVKDLDQLAFDPYSKDGKPDTTEATEATGATGATGATETTGAAEPTLPSQYRNWSGVMPGLTYEILITNNGQWKLEDFFEKGSSVHNRGYALDITLQTLEGEEVTMQTSMHDHSWYSITDRNNKNAQLLQDVMTGAGFAGIRTEWWHFQDNDTGNALKPPAMYWGVSVECWVYDGVGWRYRDAAGSYIRSATERKVDGVAYDFDASGYAVPSDQATDENAGPQEEDQ